MPWPNTQIAKHNYLMHLASSAGIFQYRDKSLSIEIFWKIVLFVQVKARIDLNRLFLVGLGYVWLVYIECLASKLIDEYLWYRHHHKRTHTKTD